ncbi:hypothetical protein HYV64_00930 [Candidatus Shapirobacteria bacterium]|nr:hypothetical protein [Candidatus Shapirobacteria bacterium]
MNKRTLVKNINSELGIPYVLADVIISAGEKPILALGPITVSIRKQDVPIEQQNKQILAYAISVLERRGTRSPKVLGEARQQLNTHTELLTGENMEKLAQMVEAR